MPQDRQDSPHTLSELVGGLSSDVQDLVRGEIALARAEFGQKLQRVLMAETWLLGGALLGLAGLVVALIGVAGILALAIPMWAASLIVGAVVIVIGVSLAKSGLAMLSPEALSPARTAASLRKDAQLIKEHT